MKEFNEYKDKLCDPLVSGYLKALGCDIFSPECWIVDEKVEEQQLDHVVDSWSGLIPEGMVFNCYRYTLSFVQKWIRENYDINIYLTASEAMHPPTYSVYAKGNGRNYMTLTYWTEDYDKGLADGISRVLEGLVKDKFKLIKE